MILVDTSVWIDHIRESNLNLQSLLRQDRVVQHPMVTAELALGSLSNRTHIIGLLSRLPRAEVASDKIFLQFVDSNGLFATGLGFVDANILLSASLSRQALLWTRDKRLKAQAERLGLSYDPE